MNTKISSVIKNKVVIYLASRYITYAVQFVTSLAIAAELGPYYMGIWGFVLLLLNYFQQFHFGIANSFNVLYVQHRDNKNLCDNYIANSLMLVSYLATMIVFLYIAYLAFDFNGFEKYNANRYILWVCIIAVLQHFTNFFINLFRVNNLLNHVTICQSVVVFLNFFCVFIFRGEILIMALVAGYVIGNLFAVILAFTSRTIPDLKKVTINRQFQGTIIKKGIYLFLYNSCFYFIIISIRSIISGYYSVEEFGMFTFSFSLAHAILMLLEALSFIIFPKVLSKLSSQDTTEVRNTINYLREIYITSAHFFVYLALPLFPILLQFFPKYVGATTSLNLIALSIVINSNCTGYADFLMARNKEKKLMKLSFLALLLNCMIAVFLVEIVHVSFSYVIMATLVTYFLYSFCVMFTGEKLLRRKNWHGFLHEYFPLRLALPYFCALGISALQFNAIFMTIPFVSCVILNIKILGHIKDTAIKLLLKPNVVYL